MSFRPPVPQGLIESIGHSVEHLDQFGVKPNQHSGVYLPPGSNDIPIPNGLNSLPIENAPLSFQFHQQGHSQLNSLPLETAPQSFQFHQQNNQQHFQHHQHQEQSNNIPYALPLVQEPRFNGVHDCGHGPISIQDSYGPPPSGNIQHNHNQQQVSTDVLAKVLSFENSVSSSNSDQTIQSSYGPPPSGNPQDSLAFGSEQKASSIEIKSEEKSQQQQQESSISEQQLPGLEGGLEGLDIVSTQQSQSLTIPVQGQFGSYQLQFQSANGLGGGEGSGIDSATHEQLLSEGLLNQILSAIEQPGSSNIIIPQTGDPITNHQEAASFLKSPQGQETLAEPKIQPYQSQ